MSWLRGPRGARPHSGPPPPPRGLRFSSLRLLLADSSRRIRHVNNIPALFPAAAGRRGNRASAQPPGGGGGKASAPQLRARPRAAAPRGRPPTGAGAERLPASGRSLRPHPRLRGTGPARVRAPCARRTAALSAPRAGQGAPPARDRERSTRGAHTDAAPAAARAPHPPAPSGVPSPPFFVHPAICMRII